jgi:exodeoxyribonuclease VII large subunit
MDPTNVPEYSVSEISGAVKRTLEGSFARVRVRGEITELKRYPSGHIYLSLKDENAKIAAVVWRTATARLGLKPENGVEVIATGRITAYAERSSYQLIIERLEYAGAGALLARVEALRVKLAGEGLFATETKQSIPRLPAIIGLVTSPQGAVLQDIRTTIARRFPRSLLLWPVPVQGEAAAARIARAIAGFDTFVPGGDPPRPDVLIVARGGGSLEDLMAFNDEAVVRAAAACRIPLISAVGHETDTTLIDFAADRRAPTPTAAAEMAVPVRSELAADLAQRAGRLATGLARILEVRRTRLDRAANALPDLPSLVGQKRQRLDDRVHRLNIALPNLVARRRSALIATERHFPPPHALIATRRGQLGLAGLHLEQAFAKRLSRARHRADRARLHPAPLLAMLREQRARLEGVAARLHSVSPDAVLARGYALVSDATGHPITRAADVVPASDLVLRFIDGERHAKAAPKPARQGDLGL